MKNPLCVKSELFHNKNQFYNNLFYVDVKVYMTTVRIYGVVGTPLNRLVYTPPDGAVEVGYGFVNAENIPPGLSFTGGFVTQPIFLIGTPTQPDSITLFGEFTTFYDELSPTMESVTVIIDIISLTYRNIAYFFGNASFRPINDDEFFYPHTYSISPALPEGMNFNTSNGPFELLTK